MTSQTTAAASARATWLDVALTVATATVICIAIAVFREPDARPPDATAYALGCAIALPLLARRRAPRTVLALNFVLLMLYYPTGYPAVPMALPLVVALGTVALAGHVVLGAALLTVGLLVAAAFRGASQDELPIAILDDTLRDAALGTAALLFGEAVRRQRLLVTETRARLTLVAQERERESDARVERERVRLARELHDELAHSVTVIGLQADVATEAVEAAARRTSTDLGPVQEPIAAIRGVARDTMTDLRRTLGALRGDLDGDTRAPASGIAQLPALLARADAAGLTTHLEVDVPHGVLSATVDRTVHRLVQEAVTNTLRHAAADHVAVTATLVGEEVVVTVTDDGRGAPEPGRDVAGLGHGLLGMRERVLLLGGAFDAGPGAIDGFTVRAHLPLDASEGVR